MKRDDHLPRSGKFPLKIGAEYSLPEVEELADGRALGDLRLAWNPTGLGIRIEVRGKKKPPKCDGAQLLDSDGLQLWIDTRNTQNIHRASRFCHHFCILPAGDLKDRTRPVFRQLAIARAKEDAPTIDSSQVTVSSELKSDGYILEIWLPTESLHGFEPESNPLVGFYYRIHDQELGEQHLSVGSEFPYQQDPSLWWSLELVP